MALQPAEKTPIYAVTFPSDRPTYVVNFNVSPAAAADLFAIEAAGKTIRLQRIVIDNPGFQTTAGVVLLSLIRTTTAGTGGVVTPSTLDPADPAAVSVAHAAPTSLGAAGTTIASYGIFVPATAAAAFSPVVIDMGGQGQVYKQPTVSPSPTGASGIALRHPGAAGAQGLIGYAVFTEEVG